MSTAAVNNDCTLQPRNLGIVMFTLQTDLYFFFVCKTYKRCTYILYRVWLKCQQT